MIGKKLGLKRIADENGIFKMLALDQRGSLKKMLKNYKEKIEDSDLTIIKDAILTALSEHVSAVLVDPEYSFPILLDHIHKNTGIILSIEKSGLKGKKLVKIVEEDIVEKAKRWHVDAIKLLIYWSDEFNPNDKKYQCEVVKKIGQEAFEKDMLFILEILTYNCENKERCEQEAIKEFSKEEYKIDLFKVEAFESEINVFELTKGKAWVILSGGVNVDLFIEKLKRNIKLGCSGFLAGRVIWKDCVQYINDGYSKIFLHLKREGVRRLNLIKKVADQSLPHFSLKI